MKPTLFCGCDYCGAVNGEFCKTKAGKKTRIHSTRLPTLPKPGGYVLVEFGSGGTQIALVIQAPSKVGEAMLVRKWRDHSGRWTRPLRVPYARLRGEPAPNDTRLKRMYAPEEPSLT